MAAPEAGPGSAPAAPETARPGGAVRAEPGADGGPTMAGSEAREEPATLGTIRGLLLGILTLGIGGTLIELLFLEHTEGYQLVPITLLTSAAVVLLLRLLVARPWTMRLLRVWMVAFVLSGVAGIALHYRGNVEFEREMYPNRAGVELVWEALHGATPALAPGTMVLLGLVGLAYAFRHPLLR